MELNTNSESAARIFMPIQRPEKPDSAFRQIVAFEAAELREKTERLKAARLRASSSS